METETLRTIIVDDETLAREYMRSILLENARVEIVAECRTGREAIRTVQELAPDLLFLDVQMPGLSGFDVVKALQADAMPMIIFATAFDRFALDAFELHAVDYVLKPFEPERVNVAVERAFQRYIGKPEWELKGGLLTAIDTLADQKHRASNDENSDGSKKLAIKDGGVTVLIPFEDIDWVDAAGDYMCVHSDGKTYVMRCTMKELEEKLSDPNFARVHRSTLVNLNKVNSIEALAKGESLLHLPNETALKVSRNYRSVVDYLVS